VAADAGQRPEARHRGRDRLHQGRGGEAGSAPGDEGLLVLCGDSTNADRSGLPISESEIGPAVGATPGDLVPVILAALDRVAKTQEPETLSVFTTSLSWWVLRRLRRLGFVVFWPSWVMCSVPLPGLDRYVPTRPPHII